MTDCLSEKQLLEAAIFSSAEPLSANQLKTLLPEEVSIADLLRELEQDYEGRGIELKKVASGYRFQVRQDFAKPLIALHEKNPPRYTRALLETLVLIAYKQPITRGEIEQVRGVAVSSHIIKTLQDREWIKVAGHKDAPGKPALFITTKDFLDYFSLSSLSQLPPLPDLADLSAAEEKLSEELNLLVSPEVETVEEAAVD